MVFYCVSLHLIKMSLTHAYTHTHARARACMSMCMYVKSVGHVKAENGFNQLKTREVKHCRASSCPHVTVPPSLPSQPLLLHSSPPPPPPPLTNLSNTIQTHLTTPFPIPTSKLTPPIQTTCFLLPTASLA